MNKSQMSKFGSTKGGLYGQKSFGFRSQYGGVGLKNNLSKGKNGQSISSFGRLSDSRYLGDSRFGIGQSMYGRSGNYKNNYIRNGANDSRFIYPG